MKKYKTKSSWGYVIGGLVLSTILVLLLNYIWPTPWNIKSIACWLKVIVILVIYSIINLSFVYVAYTEDKSERNEAIMSVPLVLPFLALAAFLICALTGAQIFNSGKYAKLVTVEQVESQNAILSEQDAVSIALMDTDSARQLGDREIGSIENFSAFNVADDYIQLNIKGDAVKVAPLEYVGLFKWMNNKEGGVTGYVSVSPTTMTADYVELKEGMQYVPSAYFDKDLYRHLHNQFPTMIIDNMHFEVDEEGNPYYVSSVYDKTIGLFGGETVIGAIITDPVSGASEYHELADIPQWVDYVIPGDLLCEQYNLTYKNVNGYWNGTGFGANTGCMQTTTISSGSDDDDDEDAEAGTDYGYIAKDGDIYIYTGVTSMAADSSNLGFIMVNERTGEFKYFAVSSANEQSAMNAAEGEVQQYGYEASFPTLINVDGSLAYMGVLKDQSGLVKMYYMVNVEDYGKVVVADNRQDCVKKYADKLGLNPDSKPDTDKPEPESTPVIFVVTVMQYVDVDGNTYVYMGTEDNKVYKALFRDNEKLLFVKVGDTVTGTVTDGLLTVN